MVSVCSIPTSRISSQPKSSLCPYAPITIITRLTTITYFLFPFDNFSFHIFLANKQRTSFSLFLHFTPILSQQPTKPLKKNPVQSTNKSIKKIQYFKNYITKTKNYQEVFEIGGADIVLGLVRREQPQLVYHVLALLESLATLPHELLIFTNFTQNQNPQNPESNLTNPKLKSL
jgi:hypothetical protein